LLIGSSKRINWEGHVAHRVEKRGTYRVLLGKPEGKSPIGRLGIYVNIQEVGLGHGLD
jgi:hypothetical protein